MAKKELTLEEIKKLEIMDKFFSVNDEGIESFDVDKSANYILSLYDLEYTPEQGFFLYNEKYWENVKDEKVGQFISYEMEMIATPYYIEQIIKQIKYKRYLDYSSINNNRNRLVLKNGTLDISDWENPIFQEGVFHRDNFSTIQLNCNYNEEARPQEFIKYLDTTFSDDKNLQRIVGEMFGYCLTTSIKFEKVFILFGEGGTGKSVLIDTLKTLITDRNCSGIRMSQLSQSFLRSQLKDKLLNIATEEENKLIKDTSMIKAIASGDPCEGQFKYKDSFIFHPFCKLVFAMNDLPPIQDFDEAIRRRFIIIPFINKFNEETKDISFKEGKLHTESEMDGIFQFALLGLKRLGKHKKFTYSEKCEILLDEYQSNCNPIEQFLNDNIIVNHDSYIISKQLYKFYCQHCEEVGEKPVRDIDFAKHVRKKFNIDKERKLIKNMGQQYIYSGLEIINSKFAKGLRTVM